MTIREKLLQLFGKAGYRQFRFGIKVVEKCLRCGTIKDNSLSSTHERTRFLVGGYDVTCNGQTLTSTYNPRLAVENDPALAKMDEAMNEVNRDLRFIPYSQ